MGTSKGAELTLLSASLFPEIKMVIATSPSGAVSLAINTDPSASPKSSWIYKNEHVTFVPFIYSEEFLKQFSKGYPKRMEFLPLYKASFQNEEAVGKAFIEVQNINGPLLLISSDDGRVWPSKIMSERVIERLNPHNFEFKVKHLSY